MVGTTNNSIVYFFFHWRFCFHSIYYLLSISFQMIVWIVYLQSNVRSRLYNILMKMKKPFRCCNIYCVSKNPQRRLFCIIITASNFCFKFTLRKVMLLTWLNLNLSALPSNSKLDLVKQLKCIPTWIVNLWNFKI